MIFIIIFRSCCHIYTLQIINLDNIVNNNNEKHNEKWAYIPDHLYIHNSLNFKPRPDLIINSFDVESLSIELLCKKKEKHFDKCIVQATKRTARTA